MVPSTLTTISLATLGREGRVGATGQQGDPGATGASGRPGLGCELWITDIAITMVTAIAKPLEIRGTTL